MSEKTLQQQLEAMFSRKAAIAQGAEAEAINLHVLVPNALVRELKRRVQAMRVLNTASERDDERRKIGAIIEALVALKGNFLAGDIFLSARRDLIYCIGRVEYERCVAHFDEDTRRQAQEEMREVRRKKRWQQWMLDVQQQIVNAATIAVPPQRSLQRLNEGDLRLCLTWANRPQGEEPTNGEWERFKREETNEALRLWSARSAEIAAMDFLNCLGMRTSDVSLQQLDGGAVDWKTHDIVADDIPIDVKNARGSFSSPNTYVSHTIPAFKQRSIDNRDVVVLGVLSEYVPWYQIQANWFGSATILGTLRAEHLSSLAGWMRERFGRVVDFSLVAGPSLTTYPGWLFEYPEGWYSGRNEAMHAITHLLQQCPQPEKRNSVSPGYLSLDVKVGQTVMEKGNELAAELAEELALLRQDLGISRRSLFAWALGLMLRALLDYGTDALKRNTVELRRLLFFDPLPDADLYPAALYDPQAYVANLIRMFSAIADRVPPERLRPIRFFQLTAPTILRGVQADGTRQTIFAHCGGWRRRPVTAPCGNNPIHLGNADNCPDCGFLICPECGHCHNGCQSCESRMYSRAFASDQI